MSLISQLPLAAISFHCKNLSDSKRFYKDVMGLRLIEEEDGDSPSIHFDVGNIRLTLLPKQEVKGEKSELRVPPSDHLVFLVESSIEAVQADLVKRGAKTRTRKIVEDSIGKTVWFSDPDGHLIYLWQPPKRDSKNFKGVESLVKHYEFVTRALADLREEDA
jgi:glyoxylase I family protein